MGNPRAGWQIYITICIQVVSESYKDDGACVEGGSPQAGRESLAKLHLATPTLPARRPIENWLVRFMGCGGERRIAAHQRREREREIRE